MKKLGYLVAVSIENENDKVPFPSARYIPWALASALTYETAWG